MIVKTPRGEAPEEVRRAWLGLTLPCVGPSFLSAGVLSGEIVDQECAGFRVPQQEACEILAEQHPEAAHWWKAHGFPRPKGGFVFYEDEVVVLEGEQNQNAWG